MSIVMTALAVAGAQVAPAATPTAQPAGNAHHQQMNQKHEAKDCCCCKGMAEGKKMACCEKHGEQSGNDAGHAGHSTQ